MRNFYDVFLIITCLRFVAISSHLRTRSSSSLATFNVARLFSSLFFFACRQNMDIKWLYGRFFALTKFLWNCSKLPAMIGMGSDMTSTPQIAHMLPTSWMNNHAEIILISFELFVSDSDFLYHLAKRGRWEDITVANGCHCNHHLCCIWMFIGNIIFVNVLHTLRPWCLML